MQQPSKVADVGKFILWIRTSPESFKELKEDLGIMTANIFSF